MTKDICNIVSYRTVLSSPVSIATHYPFPNVIYLPFSCMILHVPYYSSCPSVDLIRTIQQTMFNGDAHAVHWGSYNTLVEPFAASELHALVLAPAAGLASVRPLEGLSS